MSTRSNSHIEKNTIENVSKKIENSWFLIIPKELFNCNSFTIITLPHPVTNKPLKICMDDEKLYEVITYDEPYRSWFIDDSVRSDSSIQILTQINPLFLILPKLKENCSKRAIPLEDLLSEKGFDKIIKYIRNLDDIADLKGPIDIKAYKYNEEKLLKWLESRIQRLAKVLRSKNIHVTPGAASVTFITSSIDNDKIDYEFYVKYAFGIIAEYLQDDVIEALEKRFNFKPDLIESLSKKRKSETEENLSRKKLKADVTNDIKENIAITSEQNLIKVKKVVSLTAKEKARQKAAIGTKTISSFFQKS